jgi:cytochrome c556
MTFALVLRVSAVAATLAAAPFVLSMLPARAADDAIATRQQLMKDNAKSMKAIGETLKAKGSLGDVASGADLIDVNATKLSDAMFPPDTLQGKTDAKTAALPSIDADRADFDAKAKAFAAEAMKLKTLASAGDAAAVQAQFQELGKSCGACHTKYRAKE